MKRIIYIPLLIFVSLLHAQMDVWVSYADADSAIVMMSNDIEIGGFQFVLTFDNTLNIQFNEFSLGEVPESFVFNWNPQGDGSIILIGFSLIGENIPIGEHNLLTIHHTYFGGHGWMYIDSEEVFYFSECLQSEYVIGDINEDLILDILDFVIIVNYILGLVEFSPIQLCSCDMNHDGVIEITDLVTLVNYFLDNESL